MRGHHSISEVMLCFHNINIVAELVMSSALPGTQQVYEQEERNATEQHEDFLLCKMKLGRPVTQIQMFWNTYAHHDFR